MSHEHVVDFPLYGLTESWHGPRWLAMVDGKVGDPACGVSLGHGWSHLPDGSKPWVRVGSLPRGRAGGDGTRAAAAKALMTALDLTLPSAAERAAHPGLEHRLVAKVTREADLHADWPTVSWAVDGREVTAHVHEWASASVGFTTAVPETDIVVVSFGVPLESLALAGIGDGTAYHFDATRPVVFPDDLEASAAAALGG